jgi:hypothetical protein
VIRCTCEAFIPGRSFLDVQDKVRAFAIHVELPTPVAGDRQIPGDNRPDIGKRF